MKKTVSTEVTKTLKGMKIKEDKYFPLANAVNVRNTCRRITISTGMEFTTSQINNELLIQVTRVN